MARFTAGASGQSTLKIQLTAPLSGVDEITCITAHSEVPIGTVSRPVLLRPTTAGIGTAPYETIQPFSNPGVPVGGRDGTLGISSSVGVPVSASPGGLSLSSVVTDFSTPPALPITTNPTIQTPVFLNIRLSPGRGVIVPAGACIILYAVSSQIEHTWTGKIEWEER